MFYARSTLRTTTTTVPEPPAAPSVVLALAIVWIERQSSLSIWV
jgi:hypothetical protein